nr:hypothetical protein A6C57_21980 [Fibrella sp. ES10-3-2-2]
MLVRFGPELHWLSHWAFTHPAYPPYSFDSSKGCQVIDSEREASMHGLKKTGMPVIEAILTVHGVASQAR